MNKIKRTIKALVLALAGMMGFVACGAYTQNDFGKIFTHVFRATNASKPFDYETIDNWYTTDDNGSTWTALDGTDVPGVTRYSSILLDGNLFEGKTVGADGYYEVKFDGELSGYAFRMGLANHVHLKVTSLKKLQQDSADGSDLWLHIDRTSKLTITTLGTDAQGNLNGGDFYIDSPEGLTVNDVVTKRAPNSVGFKYHLGLVGSVNYKGGFTTSTHTHKISSLTLDVGKFSDDDRKLVARRLIAWGAWNNQTLSSEGSVVTASDSTVPLTRATRAPTVQDPVGTYRFETRTDGYYVVYVARADACQWVGGVDRKWEMLDNWRAADGKTPSAYPQAVKGGNNQPIYIQGTRESRAVVRATEPLAGENLDLTLSFADVTIAELAQMKNPSRIILKDGSNLKLSCTGGEANNWNLSDLQVEDGSSFELTNDGCGATAGEWAFNVDLHKAGVFTFSAGWAQEKKGVISFDLGLTGAKTTRKYLKKRVLGTWAKGKTSSLTFDVGTVTGGLVEPNASLTDGADPADYEIGTWNFVKEDTQCAYVLYYIAPDPYEIPAALAHFTFSNADTPFENTGSDNSFALSSTTDFSFASVNDFVGRARPVVRKNDNSTAVMTLPFDHAVVNTAISFLLAHPKSSREWDDSFGLLYSASSVNCFQYWEHGTANSENLYVFLRTGTPASPKEAGSTLSKPIADGLLHHWVVVSTGDGQTFYVDGKKLNGTPSFFTNNVSIASTKYQSIHLGGLTGRQTGNTTRVPSAFADLRVFNTALTGVQVAQVFAEGGVDHCATLSGGETAFDEVAWETSVSDAELKETDKIAFTTTGAATVRVNGAVDAALLQVTEDSSGALTIDGEGSLALCGTLVAGDADVSRITANLGAVMVGEDKTLTIGSRTSASEMDVRGTLAVKRAGGSETTLPALSGTGRIVLAPGAKLYVTGSVDPTLAFASDAAGAKIIVEETTAPGTETPATLYRAHLSGLRLIVR